MFIFSFNFRNYCILCLSPKIYLAVIIRRIEGTSFLNHLYSVFVAFLYVFGIPVSFSSFFLNYFVRFYPKLVETTTNSTNAKPVNSLHVVVEL